MFQDKFNYQCYLEVLMVDSMYKLNDLRVPLYIMLIMDSNGLVYLWKPKKQLSKMVQSFKANNYCWSQTGVVITDKDFIEWNVFNEEFPYIAMHICLFHALRSMRKEITCEKLKMRPEEWDCALELLLQALLVPNQKKNMTSTTKL